MDAVYVVRGVRSDDPLAERAKGDTEAPLRAALLIRGSIVYTSWQPFRGRKPPNQLETPPAPLKS